jgi:hypothetical protein
MRPILRAKDIYGRGNPIPVGHSKFYQDFVESDPAEPNIRGTDIPRLKAVPLGERAKGFFSDEVAALLDALGKLRGAKIVWPKKPAVTSPKRKKAHDRAKAA